MNQITHWLDASNVYSSSEDIANDLRNKTNGRLKSTPVLGHGDNLPTCSVFKDINTHEPESCHNAKDSSFGAGKIQIAYVYSMFYFLNPISKGMVGPMSN